MNMRNLKVINQMSC
jgi:hypothetical protein